VASLTSFKKSTLRTAARPGEAVERANARGGRVLLMGAKRFLYVGLQGMLPELAVSPLKRADVAVAPLFAWDGGRAGTMRRVFGGEGHTARL